MAKYKCQNPECGHSWESDQIPVECPKCFQGNFVKTGSDTKWKKWGGIAAGVIILLIILVKCIPCGKTKVTANADMSRCKLTVKITGKHSKEYKITLRKNGAVYGEVTKKETATFSDLEGTYNLDVKFEGKGKIPKIKKPYQRIFTFVQPAAAPKTPEIKDLPHNPPRLTKSIKEYTVTVKTEESIVPLSETEFSKDGIHWQRDAKFAHLPAGTYTFTVRNIRDKSLQDSKTKILEPFVSTPPPTKEQLQRLLQRLLDGIANQNAGDKDSFDAYQIGKVTGIENISTGDDLSTYVYIKQQPVQVVDINVDDGGTVVVLKVKRK